MTETPASLSAAADPRSGHNAPVFSVSEISGALKRMVETEFGHVRVRGEISGFKRAASGHLYMALKDESAVLDAVCWRGTSGRLSIAPEDGMEVIATGRLTTYPGRSKYQIVIESLELAGEGALLKLLEERRRKLAAEGLFDEARKRALPYLPEVIGVVTSPTGAVIRDILHRLADRFPRHVLLWPVLVQGDGAAEQVAAAIEGFNALAPGGPVPRPDVLIVARGGGSLEDLWAFNEEVVVRAAAASDIPLISAVGHETDTTLIDYASDRRAPTPTAAAEIAVPVRAELIADLLDRERRLVGSMTRQIDALKRHVEATGRGLPRPEAVIETKGQQLDDRSERLDVAVRGYLRDRAQRLGTAVSGLRPANLDRLTRDAAERLNGWSERLKPMIERRLAEAGDRLKQASALLELLFLRTGARPRLRAGPGRVGRAGDQRRPGAGRGRPGDPLPRRRGRRDGEGAGRRAGSGRCRGQAGAQEAEAAGDPRRRPGEPAVSRLGAICVDPGSKTSTSPPPSRGRVREGGLLKGVYRRRPSSPVGTPPTPSLPLKGGGGLPRRCVDNIGSRLGRTIGALASAAVVALCLAGPAHAAKPLPYRLTGPLVQGGLVTGWAIPGSTITLDGKPVRQNARGWFALGFGRDAKPTAALSVTVPEGGTFTRTLHIRQRKYRIQRLTLPPKYVDKIDPKSALYKRLEREYLVIKAARERQSATAFFRQGLIWPVKGRISGVFGSQRILNGKPRRPHFGVDIAVPRGTPVRAAAAGTVVVAYDQMYFSGRTVVIDHGLGVNTVYIHLAKILVKVGQKVDRGTVIGTVGTSGRSTGPHLHWGLSLHLLPLDPALAVRAGSGRVVRGPPGTRRHHHRPRHPRPPRRRH